MIVVVPADQYLVVCREGEVVLLEQHQLKGCSRVLYQGRQVVQVPVVLLSLKDQGLIQLLVADLYEAMERHHSRRLEMM